MCEGIGLLGTNMTAELACGASHLHRRGQACCGCEDQLSSWFLRGAGTCNGDTTCRDDFYSDPVAVGYYKDHVKMWLNRRNTFTGRLYRCVRASYAGTLVVEMPCRLSQACMALERQLPMLPEREPQAAWQ